MGTPNRYIPTRWVVVKIMVPFGTLNIRCRIIIGTQKGTIILTTTHSLGSLFGVPSKVLLSFRV